MHLMHTRHTMQCQNHPRRLRSAFTLATAAALSSPLALQSIAAEREQQPISIVQQTARPPIQVEALCALYSKYEVCHPVVSETKVSANFPTEFLVLNSNNILEVNVYDARRTEFNYLLGSASTLVFGPYGLLGFLAMRRIGDVDFGFTYREGGKKREAFIRFKNNSSVEKFSNAIMPLLEAIDAKRPN